MYTFSIFDTFNTFYTDSIYTFGIFDTDSICMFLMLIVYVFISYIMYGYIAMYNYCSVSIDHTFFDRCIDR